ncbi:MAG: cytochrome ubiquinol oxidase subunit I [Actinobacteria bacterium]|nr:cytochrome ubiquinol oxidase subunit I [Actinomycetota bacterium]
MDALELSRIQFATTTLFHFIFVPLILGLAVLVAIMETKYVRTGDRIYLRMTRFWGELFLINFALGVVTGLFLEFQFGTNWANFSRFAGDIFGTPLAIESLATFFLESSFIGVWVLGWNRVSQRVHLFSAWMLVLGANLSALWILLANGWMQHPVGEVIKAGKVHMVDFVAFFTNFYGWLKFFHTMFAGFTVAAFFVTGISAYHLLRHREREFFLRSFRMAAVFGLISSFMVFLVGDEHAYDVAQTQPSKIAAMESVWNTRQPANYYLLTIPYPGHNRNLVQTLAIPRGLSILATHSLSGKVTGLNSIPADQRPPVTPVYLSFRLMVALGTLFMLLGVMAVYLMRKPDLHRRRWFLWIMLAALPLPYVACELGWTVSELGRQPWIVYGLYRTAAGVSKNVSTAEALVSLLGLGLVYLGVTVTDIYLLTKFAKKGPPRELAQIIDLDEFRST